MIQELDLVALTHDVDEYSLKRGDVGVVVHHYSEGEAFEVEFATAEGRTIALITLTPADARPMRGREVLHTREI